MFETSSNQPWRPWTYILFVKPSQKSLWRSLPSLLQTEFLLWMRRICWWIMEEKTSKLVSVAGGWSQRAVKPFGCLRAARTHLSDVCFPWARSIGGDHNGRQKPMSKQNSWAGRSTVTVVPANCDNDELEAALIEKAVKITCDRCKRRSRMSPNIELSQSFAFKCRKSASISCLCDM